MQHFDLIGKMPVEPLIDALGLNDPRFKDMTFRQSTAGSPHVNTETIFLRMPPIISRDTIFESFDCVDCPAMADPTFFDAVRWIERMVQGDAARVMIVKLLPKGVVTPHRDEGSYAAATERYHLPITTNPESRAWIVPEQVHMAAGELWWFAKDRVHCMFNAGDTDRIHLICDIWK